ncbi:MAG TPA: RNA polymerase sigma factor [Pyrinomonadaceae bacterium]
MKLVEQGSAQTLTREQFEVFYGLTMPALRSYICRVSGNEGIADDIVQEAYIKLLNAPPLLDRQRKSYLYRVATNLVTDYYRVQSRARRWWSQLAGLEEAYYAGTELTTDVQRLFTMISPRERALLWLAYVEEAEHRDIAKILGVKQKSVKVLLHRTRRKMEEILRKHGFEASHE